MYATQNEATNQLKCRELGAIVPLLSLLEAPNGAARSRVLRRAAWALERRLRPAGVARLWPRPPASRSSS